MESLLHVPDHAESHGNFTVDEAAKARKLGIDEAKQRKQRFLLLLNRKEGELYTSEEVKELQDLLREKHLIILKRNFIFVAIICAAILGIFNLIMPQYSLEIIPGIGIIFIFYFYCLIVAHCSLLKISRKPSAVLQQLESADILELSIMGFILFHGLLTKEIFYYLYCAFDYLITPIFGLIYRLHCWLNGKDKF